MSEHTVDGGVRAVKSRHDHTGHRFGRLLILRRDTQPRKRRAHRWLCRCDCGREVVVAGDQLRNGKTRSCGCLRGEMAGNRVRTHGRTGTPEHISWENMIQRCTDPNSDHYDRYGGRGITVCQRWLEGFEAFLADMGPKPTPKHSIERIENDKGYEPGNCRWATAAEQSRNRSSNRRITAFGETLCLADWAKRTGIKSATIAFRISRGWAAERALSTPTH